MTGLVSTLPQEKPMPFSVRYPAISMLVMIGALSAAIPPAALAEAQPRPRRTRPSPVIARPKSMG